MSNRLGIVDANRLKSYETLRTQPESVIRRAYGLGPDVDPYAYLETMVRPLRREPDPTPHVHEAPPAVPPALQYSPVVHPVLRDILQSHWESGDWLPLNKEMAQRAGRSGPVISAQIRRLRNAGLLVISTEWDRSVLRRRVVWMQPEKIRVEAEPRARPGQNLEVVLEAYHQGGLPLPSNRKLALMARTKIQFVTTELRKWERSGLLKIRREGGERFVVAMEARHQ